MVSASRKVMCVCVCLRKRKKSGVQGQRKELTARARVREFVARGQRVESGAVAIEGIKIESGEFVVGARTT